MKLPRRIRQIIFWLHLAVGVAAGSIVLVMAVTGVLLAFERQIIEAADGHKVQPDARRLPIRELHIRLLEHHPDARPTGVLLRSDPTAAVVFQVGREKRLFVDPYSGEFLGTGSPGVREFFHGVTGLHRWLALKGASRETGKAVTGAAALGFLFLIVSGLFLWLPKRWTRRGVRAVATIQPRLKGRARDWNWHNTLGMWCALPLIVTTTTGIIMAYPWANRLLFQSVGEEAPQHGGPKGKGPRGPGGPGQGPESLPAGLDQAIDTARSSFPTWQQIQFSFPRNNELTLSISDSHRGRPDLRRETTIDLESNSVTSTRDFSSHSQGRQLRQWVRWVHTGEAAGWLGQSVSGLTSLAAVILVWTGFALSFRRFFLKRKATASSLRPAAVPPAADPPPAGSA